MVSTHTLPHPSWVHYQISKGCIQTKTHFIAFGSDVLEKCCRVIKTFHLLTCNCCFSWRSQSRLVMDTRKLSWVAASNICGSILTWAWGSSPPALKTDTHAHTHTYTHIYRHRYEWPEIFRSTWILMERRVTKWLLAALILRRVTGMRSQWMLLFEW